LGDIIEPFLPIIIEPFLPIIIEPFLPIIRLFAIVFL
jgi:hypothetical protein